MRRRVSVVRWVAWLVVACMPLVAAAVLAAPLWADSDLPPEASGHGHAGLILGVGVIVVVVGLVGWRVLRHMSRTAATPGDPPAQPGGVSPGDELPAEDES